MPCQSKPAPATAPSSDAATPEALRDAVAVTAPSAQATVSRKTGPTGSDSETRERMVWKEEMVEVKI